MQVQYTFVCEAATVGSDGKLNVLGILNRINAQAFPLRLHRLVLVMSCVGEADEFGLHTIEVRLLTEDGMDHVGPLKLDIEIPQNGGSANLIGEYNGLDFKKPGSYSFEVTADGQYLASLPVEVLKN
jgi:hypothetical protein